MYLIYFFFCAIKRIWHTTYKQIGLYQAKKTGTQHVKVPDPWRINSTRIRNYPATRQDFLESPDPWRLARHGSGKNTPKGGF
jgi:hypothetical protein